MIPSAFWGTGEDLTVGEIHQTTEGFRDGLPLLLFRINASQERNLDQHARNKEGSLKQLGVYVHVERKLALPFSLLLFGGQDLVSLLVNALSQKLLDTLSSEDVLKRLLRLFDETASESTQTELYDGTVIENLGSNISRVNRLLEVRHQKHIASGVEFVVEGVVIDMAKHRPCAQKGVA